MCFVDECYWMATVSLEYRGKLNELLPNCYAAHVLSSSMLVDGQWDGFHYPPLLLARLRSALGAGVKNALVAFRKWDFANRDTSCRSDSENSWLFAGSSMTLCLLDCCLQVELAQLILPLPTIAHQYPRRWFRTATGIRPHPAGREIDPSDIWSGTFVSMSPSSNSTPSELSMYKFGSKNFTGNSWYGPKSSAFNSHDQSMNCISVGSQTKLFATSFVDKSTFSALTGMSCSSLEDDNNALAGSSCRSSSWVGPQFLTHAFFWNFVLYIAALNPRRRITSFGKLSCWSKYRAAVADVSSVRTTVLHRVGNRSYPCSYCHSVFQTTVNFEADLQSRANETVKVFDFALLVLSSFPPICVHTSVCGIFVLNN